jgi:hypothetical protein
VATVAQVRRLADVRDDVMPGNASIGPPGIPDALHAEYRGKDAFCEGTRVADTSWGTREFALYDLDRNALTFYRDL